MPTTLPFLRKSDAPPVIGMIHLRPLPGSPRYDGDWKAILHQALRDAEALASGGAAAVMLENFGDTPFFPGRVPHHVACCMTAVACAIREQIRIPLGINVLRNDGQTALGVAAASGAQFIRVNVLCGARVTDQGLISGIAHDLLRDRAALGATVAILADIDVKHSAPLAPRPLEEETADTLHRGHADALIVSGSGTGKQTNPRQVRRVKSAAPEAPVLVGSGVIAATLSEFLPVADGFIVGTSVKKGGHVANAVDVQRVKELVRRCAGD